MPRGIGIASAIVSALLIAAHFLRAGAYPLTVLALALPFLLFVGKAWAARLVRFLLVIAAAEWVHTLLLIATRRRETGEPWTRLAVILGTVALFTLWSAVAVRTRRDASDG